MKKVFYQINLILLMLLTRVCAQPVSPTWVSTLGGASSENGKSIALDLAGNVYTTGYFSGSVDFDPGPGVFLLISAGQQDIFISKVDALGNFVWAKRIGAAGNDIANSIALDAFGNLYLCGTYRYTVDFNPGIGINNLSTATLNSQDIFVLKLNSFGNYIWAKTIGGTGYINAAGTLNDAVSNAYALQVDANANVFVTGGFLGNIDFNPSSSIYAVNSPFVSHIFLLKLTSNGIFQWVKAMGENSMGEEAYGMTIDATGQIYLCGVFSGTMDFDPNLGVYWLSSAAYTSAFVMKMDGNGNFFWAAQLGGSTGNDMASAQAVSVSSDGSVYVCGRFSGSMDADPGSLPYDMNAAGGNDVFLCRIDANANFYWAAQTKGIAQEYVYGIGIDAADNPYLLGSFTGTCEFGTAPDSYILSSAQPNTQDIFLSRYSSQGSLLWAARFGGDANDQGNAMKITSDGKIYMTGYFSGTADFSPGIGMYNQQAIGNIDIWIACMHEVSSGAPESIGMSDYRAEASQQVFTQAQQGPILYPNPTQGIANLHFDKNLCAYTLQVYSSSGKRIFIHTGKDEKDIPIHLSAYPPGTYYVVCYGQEKSTDDYKTKYEFVLTYK
jgi:hypothetical protein